MCDENIYKELFAMYTQSRARQSGLEPATAMLPLPMNGHLQRTLFQQLKS